MNIATFDTQTTRYDVFAGRFPRKRHGTIAVSAREITEPTIDGEQLSDRLINRRGIKITRRRERPAFVLRFLSFSTATRLSAPPRLAPIF